jgi:hypothetical protein
MGTIDMEHAANLIAAVNALLRATSAEQQWLHRTLWEELTSQELNTLLARVEYLCGRTASPPA